MYTSAKYGKGCWHLACYVVTFVPMCCVFCFRTKYRCPQSTRIYMCIYIAALYLLTKWVGRTALDLFHPTPSRVDARSCCHQFETKLSGIDSLDRARPRRQMAVTKYGRHSLKGPFTRGSWANRKLINTQRAARLCDVTFSAFSTARRPN